MNSPLASARHPSNENDRLKILRELDILDTPQEEVFDRLARLVKSIFEVPIALVSLMDANRQWYKASIGLKIDEVPRDETFCQIVVATGEPLVIADTTLDPRFRRHPFVVGDPGIRFYAGMPLVLDGDKCVGTLCAIGIEPRIFSERDKLILADLAAVVQTGLELRRTAQTDALTHTLTRRGLKLSARELLQNRRAKTFPVSVIMLDIDHFKQINDRFGHPCGDQVLKSVARVCSSALRDQDIFARMGGEEFAVLLPATDADGALVVAEKLREAIEAETIRLGGQNVSVTASFGVTTAPVAGPAIEELIARADMALYDAKRAGRNRVSTFRDQAHKEPQDLS